MYILHFFHFQTIKTSKKNFYILAVDFKLTQANILGENHLHITIFHFLKIETTGNNYVYFEEEKKVIFFPSSFHFIKQTLLSLKLKKIFILYIPFSHLVSPFSFEVNKPSSVHLVSSFWPSAAVFCFINFLFEMIESSLGSQVFKCIVVII